MLEIGTSGLMSGEGKRASVPRLLLDSTHRPQIRPRAEPQTHIARPLHRPEHILICEEAVPARPAGLKSRVG
jgi:hypothetical protein